MLIERSAVFAGRTTQAPKAKPALGAGLNFAKPQAMVENMLLNNVFFLHCNQGRGSHSNAKSHAIRYSDLSISCEEQSLTISSDLAHNQIGWNHSLKALKFPNVIVLSVVR